MIKYQVILDVPAIPRDNFPTAFIELLQAIGFQVGEFSQMTGTQVVNSRRLVQGEVVPMGGWAGEATEIVLAGASAYYDVIEHSTHIHVEYDYFKAGKIK